MLSSGLASLLVVSAVGAGLPFGVPPEKEDPLMARIAPEECIVYLSWAGSAAPDEASNNELEKLLAEPEIQQLMKEFEQRLYKGLARVVENEAGPEAATFAGMALNFGHVALHRPTAIFLSKVGIGPDGPEVEAGMVVNVGDGAENLQVGLDKLFDGGIPGFERVDVGGAKMYRGQPEPDAPVITVGIKDGYFYAGFGAAAVEGILARAATDPPEWLANVKKQLPVERQSLVAFVDTKTLYKQIGPFLGAVENGDKLIAALGLDNVTSVGCVAGLDDTGYLARSLVAIDGESKGLLSLADAKPLTADDLAPIPRDSTLAVAARLDYGELLDTLGGIIGKLNPGMIEEMQQEIGQLEENLGFGIRRDLIDSLGDLWCVYHSPGEGGFLAGLTAVASVDDAEKLRGVQDKLVAAQKAAAALVEKLEDPDAWRPRAPQLKQLDFDGHVIYYVTNLDDVPLAPAWCVTDEELIVGLFPQNVKAYLTRSDDFESIATEPGIAAALASGDGPVKLFYQDTPALFEIAYPFVQIGARFLMYELQRDDVDVDMSIFPTGGSIAKHLQADVTSVTRTDAGIEITARQCVPGSSSLPLLALGSLLLYAADGDVMQLAEDFEAAISPSKQREMVSVNNLKLMGLALHNYHDVHRRFPAAVAVDEDGKPLLSWRVHILPFIEQVELYERFRLDEPWDSEHNKKLIPLIPHVYKMPGGMAAAAGRTNYVTVRHATSMFPGEERMVLGGIADGTSNTVMVVEVDDMSAVTWTKPDDLNLDVENPASGLLRRGKGFVFLFADGSVQKLNESIDKDSLNAIYTRRGEEPVNPRDFQMRLPGQRRRHRFDEFPLDEPRLIIPADDAPPRIEEFEDPTIDGPDIPGIPERRLELDVPKIDRSVVEEVEILPLRIEAPDIPRVQPSPQN